jgi:hypothetical protein
MYIFIYISLLSGGDGCAGNLTRSTQDSSYYLLISANNCTYEESAERADLSEAVGALVMMREVYMYIYIYIYLCIYIYIYMHIYINLIGGPLASRDQ